MMGWLVSLYAFSVVSFFFNFQSYGLTCGLENYFGSVVVVGTY